MQQAPLRGPLTLLAVITQVVALKKSLDKAYTDLDMVPPLRKQHCIITDRPFRRFKMR